MLTTIEYERYLPIVQEVAGREAGSTPGIDQDDVQQEIWLKFCAEATSLRNKDDGFIYASAIKAARSYCEEQRYAYTFHSGQYCYTPKEVRALFQEAFFQPECWENVPEKEDYRLEVAGKQLIVSLWDLRGAFEALKSSDQEIIRKRYTGDEAVDLSGSEKTRLSRAIDKATRYLNQRVLAARNGSDHDGPGARRTITNAHANALTEF